MSVRHFLDIDGAATLPTEQLSLVDQAVGRPGGDPGVAEFREQLAGAAGRAAQDLDPGKTGWTRICDTAWYAPYLDEVAATTEHPGMLAPPARPGDFLTSLSDPATAAPSQLAAGFRAVELGPAGRRAHHARGHPPPGRDQKPEHFPHGI